MKTYHRLRSISFWPGVLCAVTMALLSVTSARVHAATVVHPDSNTYFTGEDITVAFSGGPGNPKDWIGVYPVDVVPGSVGSTIWQSVDGTGDGGGVVGVREGSINFPGGLNQAGDWAVYFLVNDGYSTLATNLFSVVDPGTPRVHADKRVYTTGQTIEVTFTNGPANPKDW